MTLANTGPRTNTMPPLARSASCRISVPVMSAGIRSGVNWMRWKLQVEQLGQRPHQQRLGQPGRAGQQAVPARQHRGQQLIDRLGLPDDDLAQLGADARPRRPQLLDRRALILV